MSKGAYRAHKGRIKDVKPRHRGAKGRPNRASASAHTKPKCQRTPPAQRRPAPSAYRGLTGIRSRPKKVHAKIIPAGKVGDGGHSRPCKSRGARGTVGQAFLP